MSPADRQWHASVKPKWTATGQLLYADAGQPTRADTLWRERRLLDDSADVVLSSLRPQTNWDLHGALQHTHVSLVDGVPLIRHVDVPFAHRRPPRHDASDRGESERTVYELGHILFDEYEDEFTAGLQSQARKQFHHRIVKDRLTQWMASRIAAAHHAAIRDAETSRPEEAAILHLTAHNVSGACTALLSHHDYHLMMLVAQIESADESFQDDMALQITTWRDQNVLSEMSEPIRALYEILAGNTSRAEGKPHGPVEDQAASFAISERFQLDWLQAFGLCLWYGRQKNGTVEAVVRDFADRLASRQEPTYPYAPGGRASGADSPLWVLLQLYASTKGVGVTAPVVPQAFEALTQAFNSTVAFRFHHALVSRLPQVKAHMPTANRLAHDLAFERSAQDDVVGAIYALLHLPDAKERAANVQDVLIRHAADLPDMPTQDGDGDGDGDGNAWTVLTKQLQVPARWIHEAKALDARRQDHPIRELQHLILADRWQAAHECFCRRVAPRAVIDEDGDVLQRTLALFGESPEATIGDWAHGGGIYVDFITALQNKASAEAMQRLHASLSAMGRRFKSRGTAISRTSDELEERVACREMAGMVADMLDRPAGGEILALPLTADQRLVQTKAVAMDYYQATMALAR